jgi:hypothetical protein
MVLRQFIDGSISNDEYERKFPTNKQDPALRPVYLHMWFCYSDLFEHTLTGKHALNDEGIAFFERCILFLNADLEFHWPLPELSLRYAIIRLLGLGWVLKRREEKHEIEMRALGEVEVWPFLRKTDYEEALIKNKRPNDI